MSYTKFFNDLVQISSETKEAIQIVLKEDALKNIPSDVTLEEIQPELLLDHDYSHYLMLNFRQVDGNVFNIIVSTKDTLLSSWSTLFVGSCMCI